MFIPSSELAELAGRTLTGAAPQERSHLTTVIDTIRQSNIIGHLDSPQSRFMRNLTDQHLHYFSPEVAALLRESDLFGVAMPIVNAVARIVDGRRQIIVFDGMLQTIRYYADLITLLNLLLQQRSDATLLIDGRTEREALMFSSAAFSGLAGLIDRGQPLPAIRHLLGPKARKDAAIGYLFAVLFILAHETGHLQLGHLKYAPELSERLPVSFAIPEQLARAGVHELEADQFALEAFREQSRENIIPSILFFLGPFTFLEAFARVHLEYPLSVNRAEHLRQLIAQESETARVAGDILQASVRGFYRLATFQGKGGTDLRHNIEMRMPPARANWIIQEVTARIQSDRGYLDTNAEYS